MSDNLYKNLKLKKEKGFGARGRRIDNPDGTLEPMVEKLEPVCPGVLLAQVKSDRTKESDHLYAVFSKIFDNGFAWPQELPDDLVSRLQARINAHSLDMVQPRRRRRRRPNPVRYGMLDVVMAEEMLEVGVFNYCNFENLVCLFYQPSNPKH